MFPLILANSKTGYYNPYEGLVSQVWGVLGFRVSGLHSGFRAQRRWRPERFQESLASDLRALRSFQDLKQT